MSNFENSGPAFPCETVGADEHGDADMSTDRELLELAAKAIGLEIKPTEVKNVTAQEDDRFIGYLTKPEQWPRGWFDPLTDDGDALRLAVEMHMFDSGAFKTFRLEETRANPGKGDCEIFRRAIVRAAAEIGRAMP